jgi:hypothetical protein
MQQCPSLLLALTVFACLAVCLISVAAAQDSGIASELWEHECHWGSLQVCPGLAT